MASGDGSWRCTGGKSAGETERERSWKRKAEKAGAGRENTGVRRVSQRGCWWWTGKESGEKARRDHHCPGENSVQPSSDPMKRSHPGCWPTMISTESFEPFRGMESLLMAQRATNQNPFVVLLPPQFVVSLERKGGKRYIYIDLLSCALFFKRFPRRIGQLIIRRRQYGEFLLGSRNILGWKLLTLTVEGWRLRWRVWREMNLEWTKFVGGEREKKKLRSNKVIFFEERALISKSESSWTEIEVATRGERESERGRGNRKKLA